MDTQPLGGGFSFDRLFVMAPPGYNVRKAAQLVAYFALQEGGRINVLKLAKLVYLANREYMQLYDRPITFDRFYSMPHGPVASKTLHFTNGEEIDPANWGSLVGPREGYMVGLARELVHDDLDEFSDAEIDVLQVVWDRFGMLNPYQLRDYTHDNCPGWEDPDGGSALIPYGRIYKFLGKKDPDSLADVIEQYRSIDRAFGV